MRTIHPEPQAETSEDYGSKFISRKKKLSGQQVTVNRRTDKQREAQDVAQEVGDSIYEKPWRSYTHWGRRKQCWFTKNSQK